MKYYFIGLGIIILIIAGIGVWFGIQKAGIVNPQGELAKQEKPLEKYSFERLRKRNFTAEEIVLTDILKEDEAFTSYLYFMNQGTASVSGLMNIPTQPGNYPVAVMFRGFVPQANFTTGEGTRRTAEELARNGFITIAPDFLGYGQSGNPSNNSFEERFQTYITALTTLASVNNINKALTRQGLNVRTEANKTVIWGHSNGGHIAISILEITGKEYPTVLWAPVSKPFPYSILYFTDEFEDRGKALRRVLAVFEEDYDVEAYSPANYYDWIKAPLQIHQGADDEAVPVRWSQQLVTDLKEKNIEAEYFEYPGENHNFNLGSWPTAVKRSVEFYSKKLADN